MSFKLKSSMEKEMAAHSKILAWRIPWTEEPDRLQSPRPQRVGHNLGTKQQQQKLTLSCTLRAPYLDLWL